MHPIAMNKAMYDTLPTAAATYAGPAADGGLTVTLAPQSFYWLAIEKAAVETGSSFSELLVVA